MTTNLCVLFETDNFSTAISFAMDVSRATGCDLYYQKRQSLDGTLQYYAVIGSKRLHADFYEPPSLPGSSNLRDSDDEVGDSPLIQICAMCNGCGKCRDGVCDHCAGDGFLPQMF